MKMRNSFVPMICASIIGVLALSAPAMAQQKTEKVCKEEWHKSGSQGH
jgi:hypothetical protein